MTDLSESLFVTTMRALEACRTAYAHYLHLLDAQRAALRADDVTLLSALAVEASTILATLERGVRLPPELDQSLHVAHGPKASAVRELMAAVQLEAETARAGIREFTIRLERRRRSLLGALTELSGGGSPYRPPRPPPDRTGHHRLIFPLKSCRHPDDSEVEEFFVQGRGTNVDTGDTAVGAPFGREGVQAS